SSVLGPMALAPGVLVLATALWRRLSSHVLRGQRWYGLVYRAFYLARLRIWERRTPPADLIASIEGPDAHHPVARWTSAAEPAPTACTWRDAAGRSPALTWSPRPSRSLVARRLLAASAPALCRATSPA